MKKKKEAQIEEKENVKEKVKAKDVLADIFTAIMVALSVFIIVVSLISKNDYGVPMINGRSYLYVQSDSMTGTINKGDLIVVKNVDFTYNSDTGNIEPDIEFKENETIISFFMDINSDGVKEVVTHQVIKITDSGNYIECQGTYKANEDDVLATQKVYYQNVIGVWTGRRIPVLGSIYGFLFNTPYAWGFALVIIAPMFIFFCFKLYKLITTIIETKEINAKERAVQAAALTDEEREKVKAEMREQLMKELGMTENKDSDKDNKD